MKPESRKQPKKGVNDCWQFITSGMIPSPVRLLRLPRWQTINPGTDML